ncbi:corrinoid adenosyltransferase MMAB-like [Diadema setosum]|uniref:corrinoid adenosyltransferase MMAB-like n=1 Tax=Diadema setosum TaxID=31175 RepID=UPI003B3AE43A
MSSVKIPNVLIRGSVAYLWSRGSHRSLMSFMPRNSGPVSHERVPVSSLKALSACHGQSVRPCSGQSNDQGVAKKLPKIYTRTGDKGTSVTIAGDRRPKDDIVFEAVGTTDELSSAIGLAREFVKESNLLVCDKQLEEIQCILQDAGSNIATPRSLASPNQLQMTEFDGSSVEMLEEWIDDMTVSLPPLRNFILPSGGKASSALHIARSTCRRAERSIAPLARSEEIDPAVARFINRLSDYLFTAARFASLQDNMPETIYRRVKPRARRK